MQWFWLSFLPLTPDMFPVSSNSLTSFECLLMSKTKFFDVNLSMLPIWIPTNQSTSSTIDPQKIKAPYVKIYSLMKSQMTISTESENPEVGPQCWRHIPTPHFPTFSQNTLFPTLVQSLSGDAVLLARDNF